MQKSGRLELTWAGKSYETESFEPRLLVEDKEKSYGDDSPNMLIHGDNLLALKALELDYMEAVQCIYLLRTFAKYRIAYAFVGIKIRTSWIDRIIKIP